MANVGKILFEKEILLESGTNELEALVFGLANHTFGINVAKVREVLPRPEITRLPQSHPAIRGAFRLRDKVVPCVSLLDYLRIPATGERSESTVILADFNQQQTAFLVDHVDRIYRLSWEQILPVPNITDLHGVPVVSLARCDERLVQMLDFEMIMDQITDKRFQTGAVENPLGVAREDIRVVVADDSPTVREAVIRTLNESGYVQLHCFENGAKAWEWISQRFAETNNAREVADVVISDVEMPQIDGLHLTKKIKEHPSLRVLPVLLYSSIVTPDNFKKGKAVGADAQISKPDLSKVVEVVDRLIAANRTESTDGAAVPTSSETFQEKKTLAVAPVTTTNESTKTPAKSADSAQPTIATKNSQTNPSKTTESQVPEGVDHSLFSTFRHELKRLVDHLEPLQETDQANDPPDAIRNEWLRILHTVKSAAMVLPLEEVVQTTHLLESALAHTREAGSPWPEATLRRYVEWLRELTMPGNPRKVLADVGEVQALITESLAAAAV